MEQSKKPLTRIEIIRQHNALRKFCTCGDKAKYLVDETNRTVECEECGAFVDAFDALLHIVKSHEKINRIIDDFEKARDDFTNYKPELQMIKIIEEKSKMGNCYFQPSCPHCDESISLYDLAHGAWVANVPKSSNPYDMESYWNKLRKESGLDGNIQERVD